MTLDGVYTVEELKSFNGKVDWKQNKNFMPYRLLDERGVTSRKRARYWYREALHACREEIGYPGIDHPPARKTVEKRKKERKSLSLSFW